MKRKVHCGGCWRVLAYRNSRVKGRQNGGAGLSAAPAGMKRRIYADAVPLFSEDNLNLMVLEAIERVVYVAQMLEVRLESGDQ